ncbi:hypothetical protein [Marinitoga sp. 1155]|uniref:hypothetical protein n=1 Tax=Marinitoga sp. 1155 TaxID=1428448 RepID=UPI000641127D|nr:hypothetical protein [Marinitoga sp. 1155]AJW77000.1 hypothetical protein UF09_34 [Marinitoga camini virus 2]KLO24820.1 hypothetical protein X274_02435 [Marinitoga sp. 1155]
MIYEFGNDWIETKEPKELRIKEKIFFETQKYAKLLQSYILNWNIKQTITEKTIKKVKYRYIETILKDIENEIKKFNEVVLKNEKQIAKIFYITFKGQKVLRHGEEFWNYLNSIFFEIPYFFDHRGNIIHLPSLGGIEEQEWEKMKIISLAQSGLKEVITEANKKGR